MNKNIFKKFTILIGFLFLFLVANQAAAFNPPPTQPPTPSISSINPASMIFSSAPVGGVTINGTGFLSASQIFFTKPGFQIQFSSSGGTSTSLIVSAGNMNILSVGTYSVTVVNASEPIVGGGGTSNAVNFTVNPAGITPHLISLSPSSAPQGTSSQQVTATADNSPFTASTQAVVNGATRAGTFLDANHFTIPLTVLDLATVGQLMLTAVNPVNLFGNALPFNVVNNQGTLTIRKNTTGGDATFSFPLFPTPSNINVTTFSGTGSNSLTMAAGTYSVTENMPSGWVFNSSSCTNGTPAAVNIVAGQTTTCTFNNTLPSYTLTVNSTGVAGVPITSSNGNAWGGNTNYPKPGIAAGTPVSLSAPANWGGLIFVNWSGCDSSSTVTCSVTMNANRTVMANYASTPPPNATIIVKKVMVNSVGSFSFTGNVAGTINVNNGTLSASVPAGVYASTEGTLAGQWTLNSISCDNGSSSGNLGTRTATFNVTSGQIVTCTFTNTYAGTSGPPTLKLAKNVVNTGGGTATAHSFIMQANGPPGAFSDWGDSTQFHTVVAGNTYNLAESGPSGYTAGSWSCPGGSLSGSDITLSNGQNITCTLTNTYNSTTSTASITLVKNTNGASGTFNFTLTGGNSSPTIPALNPASPNAYSDSTTISNIAPGTYSLNEVNIPSGFTLSSASCNPAKGSSKNGNSITGITLANNDNLTCTFNDYNYTTSNNPTLRLVKTVINTGGGTATAGDWTLTATSISGSFSDNGASANAHTVSAGVTYVLSESNIANYTAGSWSCDAGSLTSKNTVTFTNGQTATCTITNTYSPTATGSIKIVKNTPGNNSTLQFCFNVSGAATGNTCVTTSAGTGNATIPNLPAGTNYSVLETIPSGWTLNSASCDKGGTFTPGSAGPTGVTVGAGQTICTFSDSQSSGTKLNIVKNTSGTTNPGTFTFTVSGASTLSPSITTSGGTGTTGNMTVNPGAYTITEGIPNDWKFNDVDCGSASYTKASFGVSGLVIPAGQTITCTFSNSQQGQLKIIKKAIGGDGKFDYAYSPYTASITTVKGNGSAGPVWIDAGTINSIKESMPSGWTFSSVSCDKSYVADNANQQANNVTILGGQVTTCTFTNTKNPVITSIDPCGPNDTIIVNGSGFVSGATIYLTVNPGPFTHAIPTTFVSATELTGDISQENLGTYSVQVINPPNGSSSGASNSKTITIGDASSSKPTITSIDPKSADEGDPGFTLTVKGTNFVQDSVVNFKGNPKNTTYISDTKLTAEIPDSDIASAGTYNVTVTNPTDAGSGICQDETSDPAKFTVHAPSSSTTEPEQKHNNEFILPPENNDQQFY